MTTTIRSIVESHLALPESADKSTAELWSEIQVSHGLDERKASTVKREIRRQRSASGADARSEGWGYSFDDTHYHLRMGRESLRLPLGVVGAMVAWYVTDGDDRRQKDVQALLVNTYDLVLSSRQVKGVFDALGWVKTSPNLAPHELAELSDDEAGEKWLERKEARARAAVERQVSHRYQKKWRSLLRRRADLEQWFDRVAQESLEPLPAPDLIPQALPAPLAVEPSSWALLLTDWHAGQSFEHELGSFNKNVFWERVVRLCERIHEHAHLYQRPVKDVAVFIGGDMVDGVAPMRDGHEREQDVWGGHQVRLAAEGLHQVLATLHRATGIKPLVVSVGGNHDRVRENSKHDRRRLAAEWLAMVAELLSAEHVREWHFEEGVVARTIVDSTLVLLTHGDNNRKPQELPGVYRGYNVRDILVLSGHVHTPTWRDILPHATHVIGGSLPGMDPYARDSLSKGCRPTQALIEIMPWGVERQWTFRL